MSDPPINLDERRALRQNAAASRLDVMPAIQTEREAASLARGAEDRVRAIQRHPDLAERIRAALKLERIQLWSGFIPPRMWAETLNTSPIRRVVVECCAEAWRRENAPR